METFLSSRQVAFDPDVKSRTVTLGGELYDPSGTLTGGARARVEPILAALQKSKGVRSDLKRAQVS